MVQYSRSQGLPDGKPLKEGSAKRLPCFRAAGGAAGDSGLDLSGACATGAAEGSGSKGAGVLLAGAAPGWSLAVWLASRWSAAGRLLPCFTDASVYSRESRFPLAICSGSISLRIFDRRPAAFLLP